MPSTSEQIRALQAKIEARRGCPDGSDRTVIFVTLNNRNGDIDKLGGKPYEIERSGNAVFIRYNPDLFNCWGDPVPELEIDP